MGKHHGDLCRAMTNMPQRMEPTGWDSQERSLFVLDDNRMYRMTDLPPPPEPTKAKAKSKAKPKKSRGSRASKRQKASTPEPEEADESGGIQEADEWDWWGCAVWAED